MQVTCLTTLHITMEIRDRNKVDKVERGETLIHSVIIQLKVIHEVIQDRPDLDKNIKKAANI